MMSILHREDLGRSPKNAYISSECCWQHLALYIMNKGDKKSDAFRTTQNISGVLFRNEFDSLKRKNFWDFISNSASRLFRSACFYVLCGHLSRFALNLYVQYSACSHHWETLLLFTCTPHRCGKLICQCRKSVFHKYLRTAALSPLSTVVVIMAVNPLAIQAA